LLLLPSGTNALQGGARSGRTAKWLEFQGTTSAQAKKWLYTAILVAVYSHFSGIRGPGGVGSSGKGRGIGEKGGEIGEKGGGIGEKGRGIGEKGRGIGEKSRGIAEKGRGIGEKGRRIADPTRVLTDRTPVLADLMRVLPPAWGAPLEFETLAAGAPAPRLPGAV
jgi:hypothetical protein